MSKKQAAEFLGRSPRSVSNYIANGELPAFHVRGSHGTEVALKVSDLERLKTSMQTPAAAGTVVAHATHAARVRHMPLPAAMQPTPAAMQKQIQTSSLPQLLDEALYRAIEKLTPRRDSLADLNIKPVLTLEEACRLSGISRQCFMAAFVAASLRGFRGGLGRGWRIRRVDLDSWIASL